MKLANNTKTNKVILALVIFLLAGVLPVGSVKSAQAQIAVYDAAVAGTTTATTGAVTSAAAQELIAKTTQTTAINLVLNNPTEQATLAGIRNGDRACDGIEKAEATVNTSDQFGDFSVIGGSPAQTVKLTAKLAALKAVIACREAMLKNIDVLVPTSVTGAQSYAKKQAEISVELNSLKTRYESLKQQQTAEIKDVLKAMMVKIILSVSKNLTTEMVNKMVDKYKISDYLAYGDAVASQVYSMKYINENFAGDARQQMMIRSILQSDKFPEKIKTAQAFANSKAQEYLGTACGVKTGADTNDDNTFIKCLAAYGAPQADPRFQFLNAVDQAQSAKTAAQASAQAELSQSDGFAPPRNCSGSLATQQQIDTQYDKAAADKNIAESVVAKLEAALKAVPPKTTQEEVDKAKTARDQAIANLNALTGNVSVGADGKTTSSPIIDICSAIDSPAKFVSNSIGDFLEKHLVSDTDLKTDNLPFYATFLSDVASNFLTNILTGGKPNSQVLKEAGIGALNGTLIGLTQHNGGGTDSSGGTGTGTSTGTGTTGPGINPGGGNLDTGILSAYIVRTGTSTRTTQLTAGQSYDLVVDISQVQSRLNTAPLRFKVVDEGGGVNLEGAISDNDRARGNFVLTFTAGNHTGQFTINVYGQIAPDPNIRLATTYVNYSSAQVNGVATTVQSGFAPRGPAVQLR